jgi:cell division protein FtsB
MLAAVLGGLAFNGLRRPSSLWDLLLLRHHSQLLASECERLRQENTALRAQIARLNSDDTYLQQLIRQELGYVRPGELVYRFPGSEQR